MDSVPPTSTLTRAAGQTMGSVPELLVENVTLVMVRKSTPLLEVAAGMLPSTAMSHLIGVVGSYEVFSTCAGLPAAVLAVMEPPGVAVKLMAMAGSDRAVVASAAMP